MITIRFTAIKPPLYSLKYMILLAGWLAIKTVSSWFGLCFHNWELKTNPMEDAESHGYSVISGTIYRTTNTFLQMVWKMILLLDIPWEDTCMASFKEGLSVSSAPGIIMAKPRVQSDSALCVPANLCPGTHCVAWLLEEGWQPSTSSDAWFRQHMPIAKGPGRIFFFFFLIIQ